MAEFAVTAAADVIAAPLEFAALSHPLNEQRNHARDAFAFVSPFLLASQLHHTSLEQRPHSQSQTGNRVVMP